jgi:hypothetical protein
MNQGFEQLALAFIAPQTKGMHMARKCWQRSFSSLNLGMEGKGE